MFCVGEIFWLGSDFVGEIFCVFVVLVVVFVVFFVGEGLCIFLLGLEMECLSVGVVEFEGVLVGVVGFCVGVVGFVFNGVMGCVVGVFWCVGVDGWGCMFGDVCEEGVDDFVGVVGWLLLLVCDFVVGICLLLDWILFWGVLGLWFGFGFFWVRFGVGDFVWGVEFICC